MNIYDNVAGIKSTFRSCRILIVQQSTGSNMRGGACVGLSLLMLVVTINGCHRNAIAQSSEEKSGGPLANMCDFTPSDTTSGQINPEDLFKKLDMVDEDGDGMVSRDEFQNIAQKPLQEEQLDYIWNRYKDGNDAMQRAFLLNFWSIMCSQDGYFRKVLCLKNGNYFDNWSIGKKFTFTDLNQSIFEDEERYLIHEDRFLINDFNDDGSVDENDQEKIFNLYCEGEMGTEPPSTSPLP